MTNKEKLYKMFELQKELDLRIIGSYGKYPLYEQEIALFVELGELMNELPTIFKHWKKTAKDNREKALEELVDCWHFAMSLQIHESVVMGDRFDNSNYYWLNMIDNVHCYNDIVMDKFAIIGCIRNILGSEFRNIIYLTFALGFTFEEVYQGYLKKNEINHKRQDENY